MTVSSEPRISGYHAHIYYDEASMPQALALCEQAAQRFTLSVGRAHRQPVGPHPDWSCQLGFAPAVFAELIPWLALNRGGLVVFIHPLTGDELADHRDHAIWMGAVRPLKLSIFAREAETPDLE